MSSLEVETGIVCEDVRREDNGKLIIIGAFSNNIALPAFPATLVLACVIIATAAKPCAINTEFRAILDGNEVIRAQGRAKISQPGRVLIPLQNILINANAPGTLSFEFKVGEDWKPVCALPLELLPPY